MTGEDSRSDTLKPQLEWVSQLPAGKVQFIVNIMVEGELAVVEEALDKIVRKNLTQSGIQLTELARFSRVPGYPKPTMRIGTIQPGKI